MKAQTGAHLLLLSGSLLAGASAAWGQTASPAPKPSQPAGLSQAATGAAKPKEAHPAWVRKADKGFFDHPMAVHPTLNLLAVIRTDTASFASVELFDLTKKNKVAGFPLGDAQQTFEQIAFIGQDRSLVIVVRDSKTGQRTVQRFDNDGKPAGLLGPARDFGFASRGDAQYLVRWDQSEDKKTGRQLSVAVHNLGDFASVGKPNVFLMNADGVLNKPAMKVLSWLEGYTRIFGLEAGGYDKTKDMRLPDRAVIYDVLRGEFSARHEISDVAAWETVKQLRARRSGRTAFAETSEDQSNLQLIDGLGARASLALATPFESYDLGSLVEQEVGDELYFSLTVDPLNPEALTRKRVDAPKLDLYRVALPAPGALRDGNVRSADHLIRTPMDERPIRWVVAGSWLVLLRKYKNFARGGEVLEVYRLP